MPTNIEAHKFYVLRNPILPYNGLKTLNELLIDNEEDDSFLNNALRERFASPLLQEAIYMASPDFYETFATWIHQKDTIKSEDKEALLLTLYKYYSRMCSRATPYGLFAGCSVGYWSNHSNVLFDTNKKCSKYSRLDMNYVAELAKHISESDSVKKSIKYYLNNSLYKINGKYRYVESKIKDKRRSYILSSVALSPYLKKVIERSRNGATIFELSSTIIDNEITLPVAEDFIKSVIDSQILVSELEPTVTGEEFYKKLIRKVANLPVDKSVVQKLDQIQSLLEIQTYSPKKYFSIGKIINDNFVKTTAKDLIQTDLIYNTPQNNLSESVQQILINELSPLFSLSKKKKNKNIEGFKKRFYERYEEQEVPLSWALDAESGVGYGSATSGGTDHLPLIRNISLLRDGNDEITLDALNKFKLKVYEESLRLKQDVIKLTDQALEEIKNPDDDPKIPDSLFIFGSIFSPSTHALDEGDFTFELSFCYGPSAANLLGRFCHASQELSDRVAECIKSEESNYPDTIFAEVVHLPESRVGNILMRPTLRRYEIPYLSPPSVEKDGVIPVSDILISVKYGKKVVLRSKKHNKEVIPRLSSAHNYRNGLGIYKFLCDLQGYDSYNSIQWEWGFLSQQSFLPRVEYKHYILSRARWIIRTEDIEDISTENNAIVAAFAVLRNKYNIPQQVVLAEGDNKLLLDLGNRYSLKILLKAVKKRKSIVLMESLLRTDNCFIQDAQGIYSNEIIIPIKKTIQKIEKRKITDIKRVAVQRKFLPGSEWLYLKIYSGTKMADRILTEQIKPLAQKLLDEKIISKWFFIRYHDPETHLRIRFHCQESIFCTAILEDIQNKITSLLSEGVVQKVQTDTYEREIERYGSSSIVLAEELFFYDSLAIVEIIDLLEGDAGEKYRWLLALRGIDSLMSDFNCDTLEKSEIMDQMRTNFFREFGGDKALKIQLDGKYRDDSKDISSFLNSCNDKSNGIEEATLIFRERSDKFSLLLPKLRDALDSDGLDLNSILPSYVHMFMNRLFISSQRLHELVVYHYLSKYYKSEIARSKKRGVRQDAGSYYLEAKR